jgi:hypothetical protein
VLNLAKFFITQKIIENSDFIAIALDWPQRPGRRRLWKEPSLNAPNQARLRTNAATPGYFSQVLTCR